MKVRSLLLGSVAAAGLSTGAFAADLGVLTSLDVCDALGLSGLTISSETNCLQITGGITYEFQWGDYEGDSTTVTFAGVTKNTPAGAANDGVVVTGAGAFTIAPRATRLVLRIAIWIGIRRLTPSLSSSRPPTAPLVRPRP
jgi:hypothetical protein